MARESDLWRWLSTARLHFKRELHMTRVENAVAKGFPDVEGCLRGQQFFIELKCATVRKHGNLAFGHRITGEQAHWLDRRFALSGHAWVLIQVGTGASATRYLVPGSLAPRLFKLGGMVDIDDVQHWCVLPTRRNAPQLNAAAVLRWAVA